MGTINRQHFMATTNSCNVLQEIITHCFLLENVYIFGMLIPPSIIKCRLLRKRKKNYIYIYYSINIIILDNFGDYYAYSNHYDQ